MKLATQNRSLDTHSNHPVRSTAWRIVACLVALAVAVVAFPGVAAAAPSGKVNLNTGSAEQLELLPRVGPSIAQRILEYREQNGKFSASEDLMLVRGIGEKTYDGMAPYLTLEGETTLTEKVRTPRKPADTEDGDED